MYARYHDVRVLCIFHGSTVKLRALRASLCDHVEMAEAMSIPEYSATELVALRVNHLLFLNRMSQRELAMRLGTKPTTVNSKMNRSNRWNLDEILHLAEIFGVSTDYLLGRAPIESAVPVNTKRPASEETGRSDLVAGAGFEPTTSGL
ncbi:helix-turn-helix domain-containing protein [Agromyces mariniharenae]|uniref:Helix-turn-helix domain-containing protein n=1 Tax=Agromyces mariniharenae TaxID=2604423 RepID=A0A5S4UXC9_9MICO|nr:helix-turn-helix domain-containing protein [Agromyces mariniharenae]